MSWAAARPQLGKVGCVCLTLAAAMVCAVQEACAIMASVLEDSVPAEGRTKGRLYELARIRCCCCQLAPLAIRSPALSPPRDCFQVWTWYPQTPVPLPNACS